MSVSIQELLDISINNPTDTKLRENYVVLINGLLDPGIKGTSSASNIIRSAVDIIKEPGMLDKHVGDLLDVIVKLLEESHAMSDEDAKKKPINENAASIFAQISQTLQNNQHTVIKHIVPILTILGMESNAKWSAYSAISTILVGTKLSVLATHAELLIKASRAMPQVLPFITRVYPLNHEAVEKQVPFLVDLYHSNKDYQSSIMSVLWEISKKNAIVLIPHLETLKEALNDKTSSSLYVMIIQNIAQTDPKSVKPFIADCVEARKLHDNLKQLVPQVVGYAGQIDEAAAQESLSILWEMLDEAVAGGNNPSTVSVILRAIKNAISKSPILIQPYLDRVKGFLKHPAEYVQNIAEMIIDLLDNLPQLPAESSEASKASSPQASSPHPDENAAKVGERSPPPPIIIEEPLQNEAVAMLRKNHEMRASAQLAAARRTVELPELNLESLDDDVEKFSLHVEAPLVTVDDVKKCFDKDLENITNYIMALGQKLPIPVRFATSGIAMKTFRLHFVCGLQKQRCKFDGSPNKEDSTFITTTYDVAKWLKIGILAAKISIAVFDKETTDPVLAGEEIFQEIIAKGDEKYVPFISQPFLTSAEQDQLIKQLRSERYFDIFNYYPANASWACIRCLDDADDEKAGINPSWRRSASPLMGSSSSGGMKLSGSSSSGAIGGPPSPNPRSSMINSKGIPIEATSTIMTGWLKKKGKYTGAMKDRWCVLTREDLTWAIAKDAPKKRGLVFVKDIINVQDVDSKAQFSFKLVTRKQTYVLTAPTAEEQQKWIVCLKRSTLSTSQ